MIFILQKRAVRTLASSDYRTNSAPLFLEVKILDIFKLNAFHGAKFMNLTSPNTSSLFSNLYLLKSADDY